MKWPMIYPRGAAHTFYLRLGIPRRLQALYGHKEVLRSQPRGREVALTMRFESLDDDPSQIHKLLDQVLFEHIKTPLPASWHFGAGQVVFLAMTEECSR